MAELTTGFVIPELNAEGIPIPFALDNWIDAFHVANQDRMSNSGRLWDQDLREIAVGGMTISIITRDAYRKPITEFDECMDQSYVIDHRDVQAEVTRCITGTEHGRGVALFKSTVSTILLPTEVAPEVRYSAKMWLRSYGYTRGPLADDVLYDQVTRDSRILPSATAIIGRVKQATVA